MNKNIIPGIILLIIIFAIGVLYTRPVTSKTYLGMVYLYILFGIMGIMIIANNFMAQYSSLMLIFLALISIVVISVIFYTSPMIANIGYIIFIILQGIILSAIFNTQNNLTFAIIMTTILFLVFTGFIFMLPNEMLIKIVGWSKYLASALCLIIIVQLVMLFTTKNPKYYKYMYYSVIIVMLGLLLTSTSSNILKSQMITKQKHTEINYPADSMGIVLNYINVFVSFVGITN